MTNPSFMKGMIVCLSLLASVSFYGKQVVAQQKPAYQLFNAKGKRISYKKFLRKLTKAELIFFGESHNDPIAHWLTLELCKDLAAHHGADEVVVGMEMFETHQQDALDAYAAGELSTPEFESQTDLWPNYPTDYKPLVQFCLEQDIPVVATNVPRTYARRVSREGLGVLDSLPAEELALLPPLPIPLDYDLPSYARMRDMLGSHEGSSMKAENFIAAQAIKDATMSDRILSHWPTGKVFLHVNGSYHSDHKEGIVWYVRQTETKRPLATISVVSQPQVSTLDESHEGKADFLIAVPESMTKTYVSPFR